MIGEIWIQANMTEDGTVHLLVAPGIADKIKNVVVYEIGNTSTKCQFEIDEENGKYIDANVLRQRIRKAWDAGCIARIEDVESVIDELPDIDPESLRPVAHWDGQYDGYSDGEPVYDVWTCSNCGHIIDDGTDCEDDLPHYCPACGAKMGGDV